MELLQGLLTSRFFIWPASQVSLFLEDVKGLCAHINLSHLQIDALQARGKQFEKLWVITDSYLHSTDCRL